MNHFNFCTLLMLSRQCFNPSSAAALTGLTLGRSPCRLPSQLQNIAEPQQLCFLPLLSQQLLLSLVDQHYFGAQPPGPGETSRVWEQVMAEHSSVPFIPGACMDGGSMWNACRACAACRRGGNSLWGDVRAQCVWCAEEKGGAGGGEHCFRRCVKTWHT